MKKWLLVLIALLAGAFIASPAMGYISVKYIYSGDYDGWCTFTLDQTNTDPDWYMYVQRAPSGPITTYSDQGILPWSEERQTDRTFNIWTGPASNPGWIAEPVTQFYTYPGYDPLVTIVPVMDKFFFV